MLLAFAILPQLGFVPTLGAGPRLRRLTNKWGALTRQRYQCCRQFSPSQPTRPHRETPTTTMTKKTKRTRRGTMSRQSSGNPNATNSQTAALGSLPPGPMDYSDGKEELKWQNIDADDLPA